MSAKLEHYRQIDIVRNAEKESAKQTGTIPFDISHWDSGCEYNEGMMSILRLDPLSDFFKYSYSYAFDTNTTSRLLQFHLYADQCALFHSATAAIATICSMLAIKGVRKVCLLNPSYFSVAECLDANHIISHKVYYDYDGTYHIPFEEIDKFNPDAVWITQPVFSTGTYLNENEINILANKKYFLICDASMCDKYNYLQLSLDYDKSIVLYSPHKVIAVNGVKFCYVLCNKDMKILLEDLGDTVAGGLPASSLLAIKHYLSDNYDECLKYHHTYTLKSHQILHDLTACCLTLKPCGNSSGSYETYTISKIPYKPFVDLKQLYEFFSNTSVSFVPGCANGFSKANGFCFRVNHTLDIGKTTSAMLSLMKYFS